MEFFATRSNWIKKEKKTLYKNGVTIYVDFIETIVDIIENLHRTFKKVI